MIQNFLELVELEVRETLTNYEFPGDDIPLHFQVQPCLL